MVRKSFEELELDDLLDEASSPQQRFTSSMPTTTNATAPAVSRSGGWGWLAAAALAVGTFWAGLHLDNYWDKKDEVRISALRQLNGDEIPPVAPATVAQKAREGDEKARDELRAKKPQLRSIDDALALSVADEKAAQAAALQRFDELKGSLESGDLAQSEIAELLALIEEPRTSRTMLEALARTQGSLAPDLLFEASERYKKRPEIVELARHLLQSEDVRLKASSELSIVIDAWSIASCKEARELLELAETEADSRAVMHLVFLAERRGCGSDKSEDCYPCLRGDRLLTTSLRRAQDRIARKFR